MMPGISLNWRRTSTPRHRPNDPPPPSPWREEVGNQAADEEADDHHVVGQIEGDALAGSFQAMRVVGEEHQRGQTGGTDGVALGHGLGGVADGIQRIGDVTHFLRQTGHFGDAAGVVGDRAVGVEGNDDTGHRQHRGGGDGDAEQAGPAHRQRRWPHRRRAPAGGSLHRDADAGDDVGRVTGLAGAATCLTGAYSVPV
jgi:hypothetical protein